MADLSETLTYLRAAYPRAQFPPETVTVYAHELADLPDAEVAAACRRIARRSMYLPTIAEIRREVVEHRFAFPSGSDAWRAVLDGRVRELNCPPLTAAYEALGGAWAVKTSTNLGAMRHAFERDYDARVERIILAEMGAGPVLPPAGSPRALMGADVPSTPVERRMADRMLGRPLTMPSEEEKRDAVRVLRDGPSTPDPLGDAIYCEAERIFADAEVPKWQAPGPLPSDVLRSVES